MELQQRGVCRTPGAKTLPAANLWGKEGQPFMPHSQEGQMKNQKGKTVHDSVR